MNSFLVASWVFIQTYLTISHVSSANILFFHHVAGYSHLVATRPLAEALTNLGHQVSYLAPYRYKHPNPNITEFVPQEMSKLVHETNAIFDINLRVQNQMIRVIDVALNFAYQACESLYSSQEFQNWLKINQNIDMIIIDKNMPECAIGIAYKLGAKYIIFSTIPPFSYEHDAFGHVPESSAIPEMDVYPPTAPMNFFARVGNALMLLRWRLHHVLYSMKIDSCIRNALQVPGMPYIGELMSKVDLVFSTGDVFSDYPRALPPNVINIAGIHGKESVNKLPQNLESFVSSNDTDGFVYISLGSLVVSSDLPENIKQVFFQTIKSLPRIQFVWKWNGDIPEQIPKNLFLGNWFPQIDILGHPRIRAFVTQAGRPSALEALFNGVPMIAFPILVDQDVNANRMAETGAAIKLEIGTVTVNEFNEAINKSVYDPSVKARLTKIQKAFRDKPMSPSFEAVWWTEYVLRTDDMSHLRAAGINQNWFVRRKIDVWAFLSIVLFVSTITIVTLMAKICRKFVEPKLKKA